MLLSAWRVCLGMVTNGGCMRAVRAWVGHAWDAAVFHQRPTSHQHSKAVERFGLSPEEFDRKLTIFNQTNPLIAAEDKESHDTLPA